MPIPILHLILYRPHAMLPLILQILRLRKKTEIARLQSDCCYGFSAKNENLQVFFAEKVFSVEVLVRRARALVAL